MSVLLRRVRRWLDYLRPGKPVLDYIELQFEDRCNLNCAGCSHYSPLVGEPGRVSRDETLASLRKLAAKFSHIRHVRIVGGEPLLDERLLVTLSEIRAVLPKSRIAVVTNGILLLSKAGDWFEKCRRLDIKFSFSVYPPVAAKTEEILEKVSAAGIEIHAIPCKVFLAKLDLKASGGCRKRFRHCRLHAYCPFLRNGRIYPCAESALAGFYNVKFGENIPACEGLIVDTCSGRQILKYLMTPIAHCAYCAESQRSFDWHRSDQQAGEWQI